MQTLQAGIPLALLDASIPQHIFDFWHSSRLRRTLFKALIAAFSLIIPHSDIEVGRFRLLGATLAQMPGWCNDLAYACALSTPVANLWRPAADDVSALAERFSGRAAWLVCNVTAAEEPAIIAAQTDLERDCAHALTVLVPLDASRAAEVAAAYCNAGCKAVCASSMPASRAFLAAS